MNNYNDFEIVDVSLNELYIIMKKKDVDGYRLSQICATAYEGYNEIIYSVGKEYTLEHYRVKLRIDEEIKSFSNCFPVASLYENEIKELWGVKVVGIELDYDNKFYRIAKETPFKKEVKADKKEGN